MDNPLQEKIEENSLQAQEKIEDNLIIAHKKHLKWIFIDGCANCGKTTIAATLGLLSSKLKESALVISSDSTHNLSRLFNQKISFNPTAITQIPNLFAMEISSNFNVNSINFSEVFDMPINDSVDLLVNEFISAVPGIDEVIGIIIMLEKIKQAGFSLIIFDISTTGGIFSILSMPKILEKGLSKLIVFKQNLNFFNKTLGELNIESANLIYTSLFEGLEELQVSLRESIVEFIDPDLTYFILVCIPDIISMSDTENLLCSLCKINLNVEFIIINQVIPKNNSCKNCQVAKRAQKRYIKKIKELYEDFNLIFSHFSEDELNNLDKLTIFSSFFNKISI